MKLRHNAKEVVLLEIDGLGLILGEVRYNKQTETALFILEKAAYFDLYLPCAVIYDARKGVVVQPHILGVLSTGSIRVQRSKVSCFIFGDDLSPHIKAQYQAVLAELGLPGKGPQRGSHDEKGDDPHGPSSGGPRLITLPKRHP